MLLYLGVLVACLIGTAPLELCLHVGVYRQWRRLLATLAPVVVIFGAWELYAIHRGQWRYVRRWLIGVRLPGDLPIEELIFLVVIPICAVLTLEAVRRRRPDWAIGDEE